MLRWMMVWSVAAVLAAPVLAQETTPDGSSRVRGVVKEIKADQGSTDAGTLVVTVKKGDAQDNLTFVVKADASIKSAGNVIKFTDIKVGDKIRVDYKEADGKKVPSKVRVENDEN
jgi:hypothetical protein